MKRAPKPKKPPPFPFFIEAIEEAFDRGLDSPLRSRKMFGCVAYYVGPRIVAILHEDHSNHPDNGIWVVADFEHHASLKKDFPSLMDVSVLSSKGNPTRWQNLPSTHRDFEEDALKLIELIMQGDPRIGRVPKPKKRKRRG